MMEVHYAGMLGVQGTIEAGSLPLGGGATLIRAPYMANHHLPTLDRRITRRSLSMKCVFNVKLSLVCCCKAEVLFLVTALCWCPVMAHHQLCNILQFVIKKNTEP